MIKRLLSIVMALCMIFVVTPINVYAQEKVEYSNDGLEEGVYEFDITNLKVGDKIVIYENKETGEELAIDVLPSNQIQPFGLDYSCGSWSGGTIPSGSFQLYPHRSTSTYEVGFNVDVTAYPIKMTRAYSPTYWVPFLNISNAKTSILQTSPNSNFAATAIMEWTANGSVNGWTTASCSCYLKFELNTKGQSRISYRM